MDRSIPDRRGDRTRGVLRHARIVTIGWHAGTGDTQSIGVLVARIYRGQLDHRISVRPIPAWQTLGTRDPWNRRPGLHGGFIIYGNPNASAFAGLGPSIEVGGVPCRTESTTDARMNDATGAVIFFNDNWRSHRQAK